MDWNDGIHICKHLGVVIKVEKLKKIKGEVVMYEYP